MKKESIFDKGVFTLSLDTELAWGTIDKPISLINSKEYFHNTRQATNLILELLEKYEISATWAVVGSLLLEEPNSKNKLINDLISNLDENVKKQYIGLLEEKELWCAEDMFKEIQLCPVYQEIGLHSFSHVIFSDKKVTKDIAVNEFKRGMNILKEYDEEPTSFVFPRNEINYLKELKEEGFNAYRGMEPSWYINKSERMKKIYHMIDQTLAITPPVVTPIKNHGLINVPASMLYLPMHGFRKYIPLKSRIKKAYKGIQRAINEKKIFHLWFHPFNIATNQEKLLNGLEQIFKKVNEERNKGNLEVMTIGDISSECLKRDNR